MILSLMLPLIMLPFRVEIIPHRRIQLIFLLSITRDGVAMDLDAREYPGTLLRPRDACAYLPKDFPLNTHPV